MPVSASYYREQHSFYTAIGGEPVPAGQGTIRECQMYLAPVSIFISKWHWVVFLRLRNVLVLPLLWRFLRWKNNVDVLTNQRVIEQEGVISTRQQAIELLRIQNVSCAISGLLRRLMNVGSVHIETAGQAANYIIFHAVPKPQPRADRIQEAIAAAKKREMAEMARAIKGQA